MVGAFTIKIGLIRSPDLKIGLPSAKWEVGGAGAMPPSKYLAVNTGSEVEKPMWNQYVILRVLQFP